MSIEMIFLLILAPIIILVIWFCVYMCKSDTEYLEQIYGSPKFIIKPSYNLGFEIWKKEIWPCGGLPIMHYQPLYGQYATLEQAEEQLKHYNGSNDGISDDKN